MISADTIFVAVPVAAVREQLRCPWCDEPAVEFDRPTLGEPWRVGCPNMHVYSVKVDLTCLTT